MKSPPRTALFASALALTIAGSGGARAAPGGGGPQASASPDGGRARSVGTASPSGGRARSVGTASPSGGPGLDDYRRLRALTIDLLGRVPTRAEVAALEGGLDLDGFIDAQLTKGAHVERLTRTYLDLLRLTAAPSFHWYPDASILRRVKILGPDGREEYVYFRRGQRRLRPETDGEFCLTEKETGLKVRMANELVPAGTPLRVDAKVLESATRVVKPWWLYRDLKSATPTELYGQRWSPGPQYKPVDALLLEPDGSRTVAVRVCREEASEPSSGTVLVTGRDAPVAPEVLGRQSAAPVDTPWSKQHKGESIDCRSAAGVTLAADCGCGGALWACLPGDANRKDPFGFELPVNVHLGMDAPFDRGPQPYTVWHKLWWAAEVGAIFEHLFSEDRDLREVLTGRWTWVNGPLTQFYEATAPTMAGGYAKGFALVGATEPLVDPKSVSPVAVQPNQFDTWARVPDRGPWAAGIATTPAFLTKYASRRARAATLYTTFLCKTFVAGDARLLPSTEPDLRKRAGCSACHGTLEPLAASFTRIVETDFLVLPPKVYPADNPMCQPDAEGKIKRVCDRHYDPAFSNGTHAFLRGAYAAPEEADVGPIGAAKKIAGSPDFAGCAVSRMASAFLGRPLTSDDADLARELEEIFRKNGYRTRAVVAAILRSEAYSKASVWSSSELRRRGALGGEERGMGLGTEDAGVDGGEP